MTERGSTLSRGEQQNRLDNLDNTYLRGIRVLEIGDESGEYAGKLLAGLGADVVKAEPVGGEQTRGYGPFYRDEIHPDRSLYFWHYNLGKRSVTLDVDSEAGKRAFTSLAAAADVLIDARPNGYMSSRGLGYAALKAVNERLIYVHVTPFGEDGPWANFRGSDLVHLALGGMMMNSGYDPDPFGSYETPPIAPQMWQAYHVSGEIVVFSVLGALNYRLASGHGQYIRSSVHQANATNTELDVPDWVVLRQKHYRQTGRHSMPSLTDNTLLPTKDGRHLLRYVTYVRNFPSSWEADLAKLRDYGMQEDLDDPKSECPEYRLRNQERITAAMGRLVNRFIFSHELWREMLEAGLSWAPVRKPEENLDDEHWHARHTFFEVEHPELGETFTYVGARWVCNDVTWRRGPRAPKVGEHNEIVPEEWGKSEVTHSLVSRRAAGHTPATATQRGPSALSGVRVVDLGWMLASAGAGRFLASMGAEVIKVEHLSRLDGMRFTPVVYPKGGRAERDGASEPIPVPEQTSVNKSGNFMEVNAGKLAISLDLKKSRGKKILEDLIRDADILIEGYTAGTMDRMGLGYDRLREINPGIIYVQQSGLGQQGRYGRAKAFGPTAQAFSGLTEMSGLPTPWPPAGIGYSYLDWFGAYNVTTAALAALYRRNTTGRGCHIDASQVEAGIYLTGTAVLDRSVNGRSWCRYGNRSPYKPAAPHGVYRAKGTDRWVAIANFTEEHWRSTVDVLGNPRWAAHPNFATLGSRIEHHDELDSLVNSETAKWDRYELMYALQHRDVPAGVAQDAEDRVEHDPQLKSLGWQLELPQTENGTWPVKDFPSQLSVTPANVGGIKTRNGPNYGEDTDEILSRLLGYTPSEIEALRDDGVV